MREIILRLVNSHQGMKNVELVLNVMGVIGPSVFDLHLFHEELNALVQEGEIIELEYVLPGMLNHMVKSIYFPKGTELVER